MAATLLNIKARMLLPAEVNEEGEEEDPRQELVEKLLEYKMYKYMSAGAERPDGGCGKSHVQAPDAAGRGEGLPPAGGS